MEFELLGGIRAFVGGVDVDVGHAKQRWVLAALLVDANKVVAADRLVDRVWGDHPPAGARGTLLTYLTRLRKAMVAVGRDSGGYVLVVAADDVDLHRFERLLAEARGTADDRRAADLYERAFALWRGEPLAGLDTPWANQFRAALSARRLAAELDHGDVLLRLGRFSAVLATASPRAAEHPLDERLAGQMMTALHGAGRLDQALAHYREFRERLRDELGADPAPALRDLHRKILAGDEVVTPARPDRAVPRQLPARPGVFTGRAAELAELGSRLDRQTRNPDSSNVSLISGGGGLGKTWLALRWAHHEIDRFPDGQLYVNLRGFDPAAEPTSPSVALRGFLGALGVASDAVPPDVDERSALYRSLVAGKRVLVVLDNAADADQVTALLPGSLTSTTLVTSRNLVTGLVVRHGAQPVALDPLSTVEALDLLGAQLGADRVDAEPTAVARLLEHCGGLPLALGIVAARAAVRPDLPLADFADELSDHLSRLDGLDTGESDLSLRAVLSWSYRALHPDAIALIGLISLAVGADISLAAVLALSPAEPARTRAVLRDLEAANLVDRHGGGRFRMHDLVRLHATEQADASLAEAALSRLVDFYAHTSYAATILVDPHRLRVTLDPPELGSHPLSFTDEATALAWFDAEHQHLSAAQHLAKGARVWHLAWTTTTYDALQGNYDHLRTMWLHGLAAIRALGDRTTEALAHRVLVDVCARSGRRAEAEDHLRAAVEIAEKSDDDLTRALTHRAAAVAWFQWDDNEQALHHATLALRFFRAAGNTVREAEALNAVGAYAGFLGRHDLAREHATAALRVCRQHDFVQGEGSALCTLVLVASRTGEHTEAVDLSDQVLALYRRVGNAYQEAYVLTLLGSAHASLDDHPRARTAWQQALPMLRAQRRDTEAADVERKLAALEDSTVDG